MPSSSSSSAQAARQHLADQLRALRTDAGISGVEFARIAGWRDSSNVTKIEKAMRPASADHVRLWCRISKASAQRETELLAEQGAMARMWVTYQHLNQGGVKAAQKSVREKYEQLSLLRAYQTKVIPGLLQTKAYTREALRGVQVEQGVTGVVDLEADLEAAVAERMDRQTLLNRPDARWFFLIEEAVLGFQPWQAELHIDQLKFLLEVRRRPNISVGIIPADAPRQGIHPAEAFTITDARLVNVELVSGYLSVTRSDEIEMYRSEWKRLSTLAVFGQPSIALIKRAIATLEQKRRRHYDGL
jgi:transcriptional regulator with XRE-family HTH domain